MPVAKLNDCDIYYEEYGEGFPVMLVAGLGGVGAYWQPQVEALAPHFRVIIHDHRGTGRSTKSHIKYSVEQMADDTLGLLDWLGIEKAHLIGHSTGGAIAQTILTGSSRSRLDKVVMYATWTKADAFFRRCFDIRSELLSKSGAEAYLTSSQIFLYPSWWVRDFAETPEAKAIYDNDIDKKIVMSRIDALLEFDVEDKLKNIFNEVLVVGIENDHLTPAYFSRRLAELIPGSQLVIMKDGAHVASMICPEEFNRIVLSFLKEGDAAGARGAIQSRRIDADRSIS